MKTLRFGLLLAFLASPIFIFSGFRPERQPALQSAVYADAALNRLRVVITKPQDEPVSLRVLDADGWPLHEEQIAGGSATVNAHLNLCALPNGTYQIEVGAQGRVEASLVYLAPSAHPARKRQITVWPVH